MPSAISLRGLRSHQPLARSAVFLDRDGTLNAMVYNPDFGLVDSPANPDEFNLLPGAGEAVRRINQMGLLAIVVSNQPGVAKGRFTLPLLEATTRKMHLALAEAGARLDGVYYCLHHSDAVLEEYRLACDCRKPRPGLLLKAAREWNIDLERSYLVGDGITDLSAGQAAGCTTLFINSRKCYVCNDLARQGVEPDYWVGDLMEAVDAIHKLETGDLSATSHSAPPCSISLSSREVAVTYTAQYLSEAIDILKQIDQSAIEQMIDLLVQVRQRGGRVFFLGVGGGAGHASHAVNDFRKIAGFEAYTPTDNVSELTARVNDDGWDTAYVNWLRGSRLRKEDLVFVFSVGGGDADRNISANLVRALQYAKEIGAAVCGVVGRNGGYTAQVADACVLVPVVNPASVTPHTESFQALIWHLLASHPKLKVSEMKWESQTTADR